jgi:hypothetical protein
MALTAEGKALTESHRLAQLAIAARADVVARSLWGSLDVADLDRSTPQWLGANVATARRFHGESEALAAAYVGKYRAAELGSSAGAVARPGFDAAAQAQTLLLAGPVRVKLLVGKGASSDAAKSGALTKYSGMMRRQVLSGGRMLVHETTGADTRAQGWRRVTDGDPCAFCAMLATRGPVYSSKAKADAIGGTGLRYHGHCGCTAEIVYGEWQPNEAEQGYIDVYDKAAQEANDAGFSRTQDSVLHRMRSNGVFRDSPLSRNK